MNRKKNLRAAAESTQPAADRRDAADRAVSAISDYAATFTPYLTEAQARIAPLAKHAQETVQPLADQARGRIQPLAKQSSGFVHDAYGAATPALIDAWGRVTPVVVSARGKVVKAQSDVLPRLQDALDSAADSPVGKEFSARGKEVSERGRNALIQAKKNAKVKAAVGSAGVASKAAGKGVKKAASKQAEKKSGAKKTLTGIAFVSAIAAIAYLAFKKFFTDPAQSDPWKAYEPASPFAKPEATGEQNEETSDFPEEPQPETLDRVDPVDDPAGAGADPGDTNAPESVDVVAVDTETDTTEEIPVVGSADPSPAPASVGSAADQAPAGTSSYVGEDPPQGFTIKGNERSMKYHTPDSGGYDRTIAEVWFSSEEAAQQAGFTKAQR